MNGRVNKLRYLWLVIVERFCYPMTSKDAIRLLLSFEDCVISERLGIAEYGIRVLRWKARHDKFSHTEMYNYLKRFGFELAQDVEWNAPNRQVNGKKKIQHKNT